MKSEKQIQNEIRLALGKLPNVYLWRNSTGQFTTEDGRTTRAGLAKGSADLIGILAPSGRFIALEVKRPGEKPTAEQAHWLEIVRKAGGIAAVVTSAEEALALIPAPSKPICNCGGSGQIEDDRGCYLRMCSECKGGAK